MRAALVAVAAIVCAVSIPTSDAEAKRRGSSSSSSSSAKRGPNGRIIPVIVPISRGSTDVVFIKELPDGFEKNGEPMDLGWKYDMFGGGEWVFLNRRRTGYYKLDQEKIAQVLPLLGVSEADVPERGANVNALALVALLGFGLLVWLFKRTIFRAVFAAGRASGRLATTDSSSSLLERMPEDPRQHSALSETRTRMRAPSAAVARSGRGGGFGKRRAA